MKRFLSVFISFIVLIFSFAQTLAQAQAQARLQQQQRLTPRRSRSLHHQLKRKGRRYKRVIANGGVSTSTSMSMANVTCHFYTQPLDHFTPSGRGATFPQRYCIYDGYDVDNNVGSNQNQNPIFFYTGNESPIDEYVNNTGLIWELAAKPHFNALVVFAEHRFEGESLPDFANEEVFSFGTRNENENGNGNLNIGATARSTSSGSGCFTYLTSSQALQDFVSLLSYLDPDHSRPVIAFGGSYGGMLSSWLRMKYPSTVVGAIASSAPVFGFPKTLSGDITPPKSSRATASPNEGTMDGAFHVVGNGIKMPKLVSGGEHSNEDGGDGDKNDGNDNGNDEHSDKNHCFDNLLATWPLMQYYGQAEEGRKVLSEEFRLCQPLRDEDDVSQLLEWAQSPWFDLAEGDYPYNSSYIPYALGEGLHELPAWPLQEACHGSSGLSQDLKVSIVGDRENIKFRTLYGEKDREDFVLKVDWDRVDVDVDSERAYMYRYDDLNFGQSNVAKRLFAAVRESVAIWFNVTKSLDCFDVIPAINENENEHDSHMKRMRGDANKNSEGQLRWGKSSVVSRETQAQAQQTSDATLPQLPTHSNSQISVPEVCLEKLNNETVWNSIVCNENLNLIMTYAHGMNANRDFFWPPSHDRDQRTYKDTVSDRREVEALYDSLCSDPDKIYGYPDKTTADPYSTFMDDYYGGLRIGYHSNIIFSNGLLDPWSAAGVYGEPAARTLNERMCTIYTKTGEKIDYDCDMVQNVTRDGSIIAIILDLGAHHLDLMPSHEKDPDCARIARRIEEHYILKWIEEWKEGRQIHGMGTTSCDVSTPDHS